MVAQEELGGRDIASVRRVSSTLGVLGHDLTDLDNFAHGFPHELFAEHRRLVPVAWHEPTVHTPGGEGFNYIVMDDVAGKELLALRAERDFHSDTGRNSLSKIGGSAALSVAQGHSVEIGGDTKIGVKGRCDVEAGEVVVTTKGDINLNANGGRNDSAETFHYIGAPCVYVAGRNEVQVTAQDAIRLTVGSSSITLADGKITIVSPLIELNP